MEEEPARVETFAYAECPGTPAAPFWTGWGGVPDLSPERDTALPSGAAEDRGAGATELQERMAEEAHRSFEEGRLRGVEDGRQLEREARAAAEAAREEEQIRRVAEMVEEFGRERDRYLGEVEQEVVKLAMTVAARILRREAQIDPLLPIGAVRVALGQIPAATEVRLLVPAAELDLWTEAIALLPNLSVRPTVVAGEGMRRGDCRIETSLGWADLGVRAQLGEIGREIFDGAEAPQAPAREPAQ